MNDVLIQRAAAPSPSAGQRFALWQLGFRPFFLLASLFSAAGILLWAAQFAGLLPWAYLHGPAWHAHEMLFGYTVAVIAGFLLTAVRNWTGQPTPAGAWLMALAALWLCGRVLVLTPFGMAAALANAAFPLAVAVAIGIPLWRARNVRNYFFAGLLALMGVLVFMVHLALQGRFAVSPGLGLQLGLDVVLFMMVVMGGRVIPMFTNNGVPGAGARRHPLLEKVALGTALLLLMVDLLPLPAPVVAIVALAGLLAQGARLYLWRPWRTLGVPLVWILHAAYGWIVIHLALRAAAASGWLAPSYATHALTAGAIGGLTLAMMTRVALGHTARPLRAGRCEVVVFVLIQLAAVARVFGGMVWPDSYLMFIQVSGVLWAAAYSLYVVRYWPTLTRPRVDGKPG